MALNMPVLKTDTVKLKYHYFYDKCSVKTLARTYLYYT